jgi:hypothetical protein
MHALKSKPGGSQKLLEVAVGRKSINYMVGLKSRQA